MKLALLLAILLYPVVELWVIFAVADWIGGLQTLLLLILGGLAGLAILRQERFTLQARLRRGLSGGAFLPELLTGAARLAAGFLLLLPGFLSDAVALALLLPGTRAVMLAGLARHAGPRFARVRTTASRSPASSPVSPSGIGAPGIGDAAPVVIDVEYRDLGKPANRNDGRPENGP